jgi:ubiquinone/menaquinone biosynthesis C-methylase UbiE
VQGKAESLPLDDSSFDAIVTLMTLHHLEDIGKAFGQFSRVLKRSGTYVAIEWTSKASAFIPHPASDFLSADEVRGKLETAAFKITDFEQSEYSFFVRAQKREGD